ncbi:MAG: anti-sigma factor [Phycisphaerae bacterium]|nr:anti-sigma factor [Phycisphaerae bacterium]
MTPGSGHPQRERLLDLLADRAMQGLAAPEEAELQGLLREIPGALAEAEALERAAAAADAALSGTDAFEPMPASLRAKLGAQARDWSASNAARGGDGSSSVLASIGPAPRRPMGWAGAAGWLAAAACLTLALAGWFGRGVNPIGTPRSPESARSRLIASANDVKKWGWIALGELEHTPVRGDTVWSTSSQKGFMTFAGLPANDPTKEQYQLWIFDPAQSDKTPIDGGVFDVTASGGTVVVPMDPKIRVSDAVMFAVTIEKPGGVVVSDRSRLVLIAKPG